MICIDIALLLPDSLEKKAISLNRAMNRTKRKVHLGLNRPHITLVMGCIKENDLGKIISIVDSEFSKGLELKYQIKAGKHGIEIDKSRELNALFRKLMKNTRKYLSYNVKKSMLYRKDANAGTIGWIKKYAGLHIKPGLFRPHITIGFDGIKRDEKPERFISSHIAISHLGNNCTCKRLLWHKKV